MNQHRPISTPRTVADLLARYRPGFAMEQAFYASDEIFAADVEAVMMREWHFAGLANEIPGAGDYMLFDLLDESVILVRGEDGQVRAFANVCRHRGSRVCLLLPSLLVESGTSPLSRRQAAGFVAPSGASELPRLPVWGA